MPTWARYHGRLVLHFFRGCMQNHLLEHLSIKRSKPAFGVKTTKPVLVWCGMEDSLWHVVPL